MKTTYRPKALKRLIIKKIGERHNRFNTFMQAYINDHEDNINECKIVRMFSQKSPLKVAYISE